jgi:hypothetical protein
MNRREFLGTMAAAPLMMRTPPASTAATRTCEVTTRIEVAETHAFRDTITAREV